MRSVDGRRRAVSEALAALAPALTSGWLAPAQAAHNQWRLGYTDSRRINGLRAVAVIFSALSALLGVGGVNVSASALPSGWVLGYTDGTFAQPGDVISSTSLDLTLVGSYQGNPAVFDCSHVSTTAFSHTVPSTPSFQLDLDTPTMALAGCTNSVDGGPASLTFATGSQWTLTLLPPSWPGSVSGQPYLGALVGQITVPTGTGGSGTVTVKATSLPSDISGQPCAFQWPASSTDLAVGASYDPMTAAAYDDGSQPFFDINNATSPANCSAITDLGVLQSVSLTLENQDGKTMTAVWS